MKFVGVRCCEGQKNAIYVDFVIHRSFLVIGSAKEVATTIAHFISSVVRIGNGFAGPQRLLSDQHQRFASSNITRAMTGARIVDRVIE
jgi:hypothetical protein